MILDAPMPHEVFPIDEADAYLVHLQALDTVPRPARCRRLPPPRPWTMRELEPVVEALRTEQAQKPVPVPPHAGGCWVSELNKGAGAPPCGIFAGHGYALAVCPRCAPVVRAEFEHEQQRAERAEKRRASKAARAGSLEWERLE